MAAYHDDRTSLTLGRVQCLFARVLSSCLPGVIFRELVRRQTCKFFALNCSFVFFWNFHDGRHSKLNLFRPMEHGFTVLHNSRPLSQNKTLRAFARLLYKLFVWNLTIGRKQTTQLYGRWRMSRWKGWTRPHKIQVLQLCTQLRLISKDTNHLESATPSSAPEKLRTQIQDVHPILGRQKSTAALHVTVCIAQNGLICTENSCIQRLDEGR